MTRARTACIHAIAAATLAAAPVLAQGKLYYLGNGTGPDPLRRSDLNGNNKEVVLDGLTFPQGVEVDGEGGKVYWTDFGQVRRANLDGTGVETVIDVGNTTRGITLDLSSGTIYFSKFGLVDNRIMRVDLDGSNFVNLVTTGLQVVSDIAVDPEGGKLYWTDQNAQKVQWADLDGSNVQDLHVAPGAWGIAIHHEEGHLYWTAHTSIRRSELDGSNPIDVLTDTASFNGLAIDPTTRKMYWTQTGPSAVRRANLDGTGVHLLAAAVDTPLDVAIDLAPCPPTVSTVAEPYGCGVNPVGSLPVLGGAAKLNSAMTLGVDNPLGTQPSGSVPVLLLATSPLPAFPCGVLIPGFSMGNPGGTGELLLDPSTIQFVLVGSAWAGPGSPTPFNLRFPESCKLMGLEFFLQGFVFDPLALSGVVTGLTEALHLRVGV